jgi:hypothetical protein
MHSHFPHRAAFTAQISYPNRAKTEEAKQINLTTKLKVSRKSRKNHEGIKLEDLL